MNILLTSVGRRGYLVDYFKQSVKPKGRVIAANSESLTSGMLTADKAYTVPQVDSANYIPSILDICKAEEVTLVVSLFDIDLPYLARNLELFTKTGIQLVVSEPWIIDIANDKWETWKFLTKNGISTPNTFLSVDDALLAVKNGSIHFPLIVKPRWGMGSLTIFRVEDESELLFFYSYALKQIRKSYLSILSRAELEKSVVIQEFITGKEYGLDVFNDLEGFHLQTIAKQKLAMRSGETDMAVVVEDKRLSQLGNKLATLFRHRGNMDVDVLENEAGELLVLEMNARFGGGYPFSHIAGADFPGALVAMARGETPMFNKVEAGCTSLKTLNVMKVG